MANNHNYRLKKLLNKSVKNKTKQTKQIPNDRFLRVFDGNFFYSQIFGQKSAEKKSLEKYFFHRYFVL